MTSSPPPADTEEVAAVDPPGRVWMKPAIFVGLLAVVAVAYWRFSGELTLERLVAWQEAWDAYRRQHPTLVYPLAFLIYVAVTALSLPGATALTLLYSTLFGFWRTVPLVSFASTAGATLAFLLARYLLHDFVQRRFARYWRRFEENWRREGGWYLFALRLTPVVPFFIVNLAMALTPIRARQFWWISQLGMLPATCAYVYFGSQLDPRRLHEAGIPWQLLLALAIVALLPLVIRGVLRRAKRGEKNLAEANATADDGVR